MTPEGLTLRTSRADLLMLRGIRAVRAMPHTHAKGDFWGSVVTNSEVDELGTRAFQPSVEPDDELTRALRASDTLPGSPLDGLGQMGLERGWSETDLELVALLLLPELVSNYARPLAYLHENMGMTDPTPLMLSRLVRTHPAEQFRALQRMMPGAPLLKQGVAFHPYNGWVANTAQSLVLDQGFVEDVVEQLHQGAASEVPDWNRGHDRVTMQALSDVWTPFVMSRIQMWALRTRGIPDRKKGEVGLQHFRQLDPSLDDLWASVGEQAATRDAGVDAVRRVQQTNQRVLAQRDALTELAALHELTFVDLSILVLCLMQELLPEVRAGISFISDNMNRRTWTVGLISSVLSLDRTMKFGVLARFAESAPLIRRGLIEVESDEYCRPFRMRRVRVVSEVSECLVRCIR